MLERVISNKADWTHVAFGEVVSLVEGTVEGSEIRGLPTCRWVGTHRPRRSAHSPVGRHRRWNELYLSIPARTGVVRQAACLSAQSSSGPNSAESAPATFTFLSLPAKR